MSAIHPSDDTRDSADEHNEKNFDLVTEPNHKKSNLRNRTHLSPLHAPTTVLGVASRRSTTKKTGDITNLDISRISGPGRAKIKMAEDKNKKIPLDAVGRDEEKVESEETAEPPKDLGKPMESGVCTLKGAPSAGFLGMGKIPSVKVAVGEVNVFPSLTLGLDPAETHAGAGVSCARDPPL